MIKIEETEVNGFKAAIRGCRNPMNSWDKSDTRYIPFSLCDEEKDLELAELCGGVAPIIGKNDLALMKKLSKAGTDHAKYLRFITVTADITAPMFWWFEFDTYKVGTVKNSCSKMHKIHIKPFLYDDFTHEGIDEVTTDYPELKRIFRNYKETIEELRLLFNKTQEKKYWRALLELLPESYNMRATVFANYQVLKTMYHARKNHKLDCWHDFCRWCETLPYFKEVCINA